jgi:hypothetical protein
MIRLNSSQHRYRRTRPHASIAVLRPSSGRIGPGALVEAKIALRPTWRALIAALVLGGALVLPSSALALTLT